MPNIFAVVFAGSFATAVLVCTLLVVTKRLHGHLTLDSETGVQKVHVGPTPRVGGIALYAGVLSGLIWLPDDVRTLWAMFCLAALPAFAAGLLEDITKKVAVKWRLFATILSGLIFAMLTGYMITHVDIPGVDWLLALPLFALCFTAFATGGIANALNIIDGFHGLASGSAIIIMAGFGFVAWQNGDTALLLCIVCTIAALFGFFILNFPFGKIFLGDAGAYSAGFLLAAVAVALPARNPEVSPLIGLIALSYPVTETMVSIWRRARRDGTNPGQPDRLHLHSLIHRSRARDIANKLNRPGLRNPLTSVLLWAMPTLSVVFMLLGEQVHGLTPFLIGALVLIYLRLYRRVALLPPRSMPVLRRTKPV